MLNETSVSTASVFSEGVDGRKKNRFKRDYFIPFLSNSHPHLVTYLAPRLHLPPKGADLHQAGHCDGWFDSCMAVFLCHHALLAVDKLDTRHNPLSYT